MINLSIDAGTAETWHKVKGVNNFNTVIKNVEKYHKVSSRNGQITLKYIIFPGLNDSDDDFNSVIKIMKDVGTTGLDLSRDNRYKYEQDNTENEKLIQSAARLATLLYINRFQFGMFTFKPDEREKIIAIVKRNLQIS